MLQFNRAIINRLNRHVPFKSLLGFPALPSDRSSWWWFALFSCCLPVLQQPIKISSRNFSDTTSGQKVFLLPGARSVLSRQVGFLRAKGAGLATFETKGLCVATAWAAAARTSPSQHEPGPTRGSVSVVQSGLGLSAEAANKGLACGVPHPRSSGIVRYGIDRLEF